jgi:hypothetical protein
LCGMQALNIELSLALDKLTDTYEH